MMDFYYDWDFDEFECIGGYQIFENQAMNIWDLEVQVKMADIGGLFYFFIYFIYYFFLIDYEILCLVYWQVCIVADMFKGGWVVIWEFIGGLI